MSDWTQIETWMRSQGYTPSDLQHAAWNNTMAGCHQLIVSPTGSGKTLAATGMMLNQLLRQAPAKGVRLIYITPLRALSRDLEKALISPLADTQHRVAVRTGDTRASERAAIIRKPPALLITTPESLSQLLASPKSVDIFATVEQVVVDEWHDLIASKRGTQCLLAIARLRRLAPQLKITGCSATIADPEHALKALIPVGCEGVLVHPSQQRPIQLHVLLPADNERLPWAGQMGLSLLESVSAQLRPGQTTLIFTNTRNQAEQWYQALAIIRSDLRVELHHGSLDHSRREVVEAGLKEGTLDVVVATSALDLGVDYPAVEAVIQIGSPRAVSRLIQRAGRAKHRPGEPLSATLVPTHRLHLNEYQALADALSAHALEPVQPAEGHLDVLMQHLVTLALQAPWLPDTTYAEITSVAAYAELTREAFAAVLQALQYGSTHLNQYPDYQRLVVRDDQYVQVATPGIARRHRMSIGTIVAHASMRVRVQRGAVLGEVEESFATRLKPGDCFRFAGRVLQCVRLRDGELWVKAARGNASEVPRWTGGRLPMSQTLAHHVVERLARPRPSAPCIQNHQQLDQMIQETQIVLNRFGVEVDSDHLLVETFETRDGVHCICFPFAGWLVHQALGPLLAYRLSRIQEATYTVTVNDYGIELLSDDPKAFQPLQDTPNALFSPDHMVQDLAEAVNLAELMRREFRGVARIAGLLFEGYPHQRKSVRMLQSSAGILFDVLNLYDPDHLLLQQARRDVFQTSFDLPRLTTLLERLQHTPIRWTSPGQPTPLSLPLVHDRLSTRLSSESVVKRLAKCLRGFDDNP